MTSEEQEQVPFADLGPCSGDWVRPLGGGWGGETIGERGGLDAQRYLLPGLATEDDIRHEATREGITPNDLKHIHSLNTPRYDEIPRQLFPSRGHSIMEQSRWPKTDGRHNNNTTIVFHITGRCMGGLHDKQMLGFPHTDRGNDSELGNGLLHLRGQSF